MAREGVPLIVIQRQIGHSNLGITSVNLEGIDSGEIIETVHARRAPMVSGSARCGSDPASAPLLVARSDNERLTSACRAFSSNAAVVEAPEGRASRLSGMLATCHLLRPA
jgi:hypothetical protein